MIQLQFLNRLLDTKDASIFLINNITEDFFSSYKDEFNYIKNHLDTYGVIPDKASFLTKFPNFESIVVTEPDAYLLDELYKDRNSRFLADTFTQVRNKVLAGNVDDAMTLYINAASNLSKAKHLETVDILQDTKPRYDAYLDKIENFDKYYISTGFEELDAIIGGWDRHEELATIVARTNQGKSWMLLKFVTAALERCLRVGIYSGEMSENKVAYRIDTLLDHISNSGLIKGNRSIQAEYKNYLDALPTRFPGAVCKVLTPSMNGGPAGVTDLRAFIEKENLDILFIDQHSLLEDDRHAKSSVEKAGNISKDLKNLQVLKKIPIISVSQQNRASTENGVGTEHVAQSDRIGQDSTIIIFFEQKELDSDKDLEKLADISKISSIYSKFIKISLVKSRDSVNMKELKYFFDFDKGLFKHIPEPDSAEALALKDYFDNPSGISEDYNDYGDPIF